MYVVPFFLAMYCCLADNLACFLSSAVGLCFRSFFSRFLRTLFASVRISFFAAFLFSFTRSIVRSTVHCGSWHCFSNRPHTHFLIVDFAPSPLALVLAFVITLVFALLAELCWAARFRNSAAVFGVAGVMEDICAVSGVM